MCRESLTNAAALNGLTAVAALLAAGFWWRSASSSVPVSQAPPVDTEGWSDTIIQSGKDDFIATMHLQSRWNHRAAIAATAAAILQALSAVATAYGW